jgi:hypothetical protein
MKIILWGCLILLAGTQGTAHVKMAESCKCVKSSNKAELKHSCIYPESRPKGKYQCETPPNGEKHDEMCMK